MLDAETTRKLLRAAEDSDASTATNQTIRHMAKELAGKFYEDNRTPGFRKAFPTFRHYMRGQWVQSDGSIRLDKPGWLHHVELARKLLAGMLGRMDVHENLKDPIYQAILDDRERALRPGARKLHQVGIEGYQT
jgi:hypothetical protein